MTGSRGEGLVLKSLSGFYYVQAPDGEVYECRLRGKIRTRVLTGDQVVYTKLENNRGVIEQILPRSTQLYRPPIANVSMLFIVLACARPRPSLMVLDRLLIMAGWHGLESCIVMNKSDLTPEPEAVSIINYYPQIGYRLVQTSALDGQGVEELSRVVGSGIAVLAGPSGAGKSSLLNRMLPDISLEIQDVSRKLGRGRHTTRHVELFPLNEGGWIADTPGFSVLELPRMKREELATYFIEFQEPAVGCRFADCLHYQERDCGVKEAVNRGEITSFRYENYISILGEVIEKERSYQ